MTACQTRSAAVVWVIWWVPRRTTGKILADRLACPFFDGDDFHPAANKGAQTSCPFWLCQIHSSKVHQCSSLTGTSRSACG